MAGIEVRAVPMNLAMVQAWPGENERVHTALRKAYGVEAADGPLAVSQGEVTLIGYGPGSWLLKEEPAAADWPARVEAIVGSEGAVTDQTGGYVLRRVTGMGAHDFMAKGAFLDLDPAVFGIGHAANTIIGHVGVTLWRSDEIAFDILVFRSFANAFDHWLHVAGAGSAG